MNRRPWLLLWFFAAAIAGSACADDRAALGPTAPGQVPAVASELRNRGCAPGVVLGEGFLAVTEIPSLGGGDVFVQDINNDGVAVGSERGVDGNMHAFRHTDLGGLQDLGALPGFGTQSVASAVASDGAIAGQSDHGDGTNTFFGYRYTAAGGRTEICPTVCSAWDLNGRGQVVGLIVDPVDATAWQAFLFSPTGGLSRLGTLGGARSSASGISESGLVIGNAQLGTTPAGDVGHAFVYDAARGMRDLNTVSRAVGWELKAANDITATQIAGYGIHNGQTRAFLYDIGARGVRDLGTPAGDGNSLGWALNSHGDVVGYAVRDAHLNDAFVYGANIGMRRLGDFVDPAQQWDLQQANGINDQGAIVGWGYHAGTVRGFKVTMPLCPRRR